MISIALVLTPIMIGIGLGQSLSLISYFASRSAMLIAAKANWVWRAMR